MSNHCVVGYPANAGTATWPALPTLEALGEAFLAALSARDFDRVEMLLAPEVRFRALVPAGVREGQTAQEATSWLRRWFQDAEAYHVLHAASSVVFDRLYFSYRLQLYDRANGWRSIEQHAYAVVQEDQIADLWLLCSGFRAASTGPMPPAQTQYAANAFYDAGSRGCAEGPLAEIAELLCSLSPGQTLEIHAADPSVASDLPAWCRLSGHTLLQHEGEHYLIRHK